MISFADRGAAREAQRGVEAVDVRAVPGARPDRRQGLHPPRPPQTPLRRHPRGKRAGVGHLGPRSSLCRVREQICFKKSSNLC